MQEIYHEGKGKFKAYMNPTSVKLCKKNGWLVDGLYKSSSGHWLEVVVTKKAKDWTAHLAVEEPRWE